MLSAHRPSTRGRIFLLVLLLGWLLPCAGQSPDLTARAADTPYPARPIFKAAQHNPNAVQAAAHTKAFVAAQAPTITRITPSVVSTSDPPFTLRVDGSGFLPNATARLWNADLPTTYVSSTRLLAAFDEQLPELALPAPVSVAYSGTQASNVLSLTVTRPPRPPSPVEPLGGAGGGGSTVIISGTLAYLGLGGQFVILDIATPSAPRLLASYTTPEIVQAIVVEGSRAYVANELGGLLIFDVANPGALRLLGSYQTPGTAYDLQVRAGVAYISLGDSGLQTIDVSDPAHPQRLGHYTGSDAYALDLVGNIVYITVTYDSPVVALDVSDPGQPTRLPGGLEETSFGQPYDVQIVGSVGYAASGDSGLVNFALDPHGIPIIFSAGKREIPGGARALHISAGRAYVGSGYGDLYIFDLSNPLQPQLLGSFELPSIANDLRIVGDLAFLADGAGGLQVLNIANPAAVRSVGAYATWQGRQPLLVGQRAFLAADSSGTEILDLSNPLRPRWLGNLPALGRAVQVQVVGDRLYVANSNYANRFTNQIRYGGLQIADISDPTSPTLRANIVLTDTLRMQVSGTLAYVAAIGGLHIFDVADPAAPQLTKIFTTTRYSPYYDLQIIGNRGYLLGDEKLEVIDLSQPANPTLLGSAAAPNAGQRLVVTDGRGYVAGRYSTMLQLYDLRDPSAPRLLGSYPKPEIFQSFNDLQVSGDTLFLAANRRNQGAVYIFDVADPAAPRLLIEHEQSAYARGLALRDDLVYLASEDGGLQMLRPRFDLVPVSAVISTSQRLLTNRTGELAISFPPAAVGQPITLTYSGLLTPAHALGASLALRSFKFEARNPRGAPVAGFAAPYTLTLSYRDADLRAAGIDEAGLNLYFWDGDAWVGVLPCMGCSVDTLGNRVTVQLDHFSEFVLAGPRGAGPLLQNNLYLALLRR